MRLRSVKSAILHIATQQLYQKRCKTWPESLVNLLQWICAIWNSCSRDTAV